MSISEMLYLIGLDVRCYLDNTTAGRVIALLMFIFAVYVYFTFDGSKKEAR